MQQKPKRKRKGREPQKIIQNEQTKVGEKANERSGNLINSATQRERKRGSCIKIKERRRQEKKHIVCAAGRKGNVKKRKVDNMEGKKETASKINMRC